MEPKTLEALRESIAHWDRLASGKRNPGEFVGAHDCALCGMFLYKMDSCSGCPVRERTGRQYCMDTPFVDTEKYLNKNYTYAPSDTDINAVYGSSEFRELAMRELEFLRSLLPEDHLTK